MMSKKKIIKEALNQLDGVLDVLSDCRNHVHDDEDLARIDTKIESARAVWHELHEAFRENKERHRAEVKQSGPSWLSELVKALGWQGGTWTQAIDEVTNLHKRIVKEREVSHENITMLKQDRDKLCERLGDLAKELEQSKADHKKSREEALRVQEGIMAEVRKAIGAAPKLFWHDVLKVLSRHGDSIKPQDPAPTCGMCDYYTYGRCENLSHPRRALGSDSACGYYERTPVSDTGAGPKMLACSSCKHYSETGVLTASGKLGNCLVSNRPETHDPIKCSLYAKKDEGLK